MSEGNIAFSIAMFLRFGKNNFEIKIGPMEKKL
jgi:hypothetical protein